MDIGGAMAQHYPVYEKDEPKVFKILRKIVKELMRNFDWSHIADFGTIKKGNILIRKLSKEYYPEGRAFSIKPITLQSKQWDQRKDGGCDFRKDATLEVHTDTKGNIQGVYYPL